MELWDAYDRKGALTGVDLIRGEKIPEGLFHLVVEVIVVHTDGTFLLMQRDYSKPNCPGLYEPGAGGSAVKGEEPAAAAVRELFEESGIRASQEELKPLYHVVRDETHAIYFGYLCETSIDKNAIILQEGETIGYKWVSAQEFKEAFDAPWFVPFMKPRCADYLNSI